MGWSRSTFCFFLAVQGYPPTGQSSQPSSGAYPGSQGYPRAPGPPPPPHHASAQHYPYGGQQGAAPHGQAYGTFRRDAVTNAVTPSTPNFWTVNFKILDHVFSRWDIGEVENDWWESFRDLNVHEVLVQPLCPTMLLKVLRYHPITYYWTVPLILDHSFLVGKLTSSKIADTKVKILEVLKLLFQQFLNLSISQRDMSGPILEDLSNNRWSGGGLLRFRSCPKIRD